MTRPQYCVAICDDEPIYIDQIRGFLAILEEKYSMNYTVFHFSTAQELLEAPFDYDILFLDIRLNAGNDGIDVGKLLRQRGNHAVFILISSLQDRYRDGYRLTAHRFLDKPLLFADFEEAVLTAFDRINRDTHKVKVHCKFFERYITATDIVYFESYYKKRFVVTKTEKYEMKEAFSDIEPRLPPYMFYRIQKGYLINLGCVIQASRAFVIMANQKQIPFPRGSVDAFDAALMRFLKEYNR